MLASAATPISVAQLAFDAWPAVPPWLSATVALCVTLWMSAGLAISRRPGLGRGMATLAIVGTLCLGVPYLMDSPSTTLLSLVAVTGTLAFLWGRTSARPTLGPTPRPLYEEQARGAALAAVTLWSVGALSRVEHSLSDLIVLSYALGVSAVLGLEWAARIRGRHPARAVSLLAVAIFGVAVLIVFWGTWPWALSGLAAVAIVAVFLTRPPASLDLEDARWWEPLLGNPERLLVGTFLTLSVLGTLLLALPYSANSARSIGMLDAAFTSVSAVCVTGLIVLDTPVVFSAFGQLVILVLIQVGGLGIMTFSTSALWVLGQRMSMRHETAVATLLSTHDRSQLFATARGILALTFIAETLGAVLLAVVFWTEGDAPATAVWRGVFTAVSAFCNAGFALQSDSLIPYQEVPAVLHVVGTLIIVGGLSPLAVFALPTLLRRTAPVSAQVKLALVTAAVLLVGGFLFILGFEWNRSLEGLSLVDRLHNAWFQSITLRTAGFNSLDFTAMQPVTWTLMMGWMFIGGGPGGTAGGVKTTTVALLALSVLQTIRGQPELEVFGKRISERTRSRAVVVVVLATLSGIAGLVVILLTQQMEVEVAAFEVVSALGTVGLSIGGTSRLDGIGKVVILVCMFIGRVGGLTLFMFLSSRTRHRSIGLPVEEVAVG